MDKKNQVLGWKTFDEVILQKGDTLDIHNTSFNKRAFIFKTDTEIDYTRFPPQSYSFLPVPNCKLCDADNCNQSAIIEKKVSLSFIWRSANVTCPFLQIVDTKFKRLKLPKPIILIAMCKCHFKQNLIYESIFVKETFE